MTQSPFLLIKQLETQVTAMLSRLDVYSLPVTEQQMVSLIRRELVDARLDIRDYELSETRAEQLDHAASGKQRLEALRKHILAASEQNLFSAVDVAQLTAQLDHIADQLY